MARTAAALALSLLAACGSADVAGGPPPRRPNIVYILADDLGYAHLGCYGQEKIRTPALDRLASEGVRFTQFYAGNPVCAPSRSCLMTGTHSGHTSVRINPGGTPLLDRDVTIGEVLKTAGYATGLFGKWGLGDAGTDGVPWKQGFDEFFGYLHQVHCHFYYPHFLWKNDQKFPLAENEGEKRVRYSHDEIVREALDFVRRRKDRPFFLYLAPTLVHTELLVPEDSLSEYRGKFPEEKPYVGTHYASQPTPRAALAGMLSRLDRDVGRLLALLAELGLEKDTVVLFTSDNGGQGSDGPDLEFFKANQPLRGAKGMVYEGGIRVPMIVRWPGRIARGRVDDFVWANWDVLPTLADLAGVKPPDGIDGRSMLERVLGTGPGKPHEFLYWEHPAGGRLLQGVRTGNWKGVKLGKDAPLELYDLESDVSETKNVAVAYPDVVAKIEAYLKTARTEPRKYDPMPRVDKKDYVR
jgi:arylsulfatase A-like enzyme